MSVIMCTSYFEVIPTLDEVKLEISNIVGLPEIKAQLGTIVDMIIDAEKYESCGFTVIPPKPFHMVFVGNNGTGKSMIARILAKLFYLAGALTSFTVTEMQGNQKMKDAEGGVLLVNVDEEDLINSKTLEDIIAAMDEGNSSIIFAGNSKDLNKYMKFNNELYSRFSARLQFDDLNCEELAKIIQQKANIEGDDNLIDGFELDALCSTDNISQIIAEFTPANLRSMLNAHLLDQMLIDAKKFHLKRTEGITPVENVISLKDLALGILIFPPPQSENGTPTAVSSSTPRSSNSTILVALGVGIGIGVTIVMVCVGIFFIWYKKRKRRHGLDGFAYAASQGSKRN